jgi:hypothetical protein
MQSTSMYDVTLDQCADLIQAAGSMTTFLLQGGIGIGKSALLHTLASRLPTHHPVYFDCTTKDLGDIMLPRIAEATADAPYVSFAPNEELGLHHNRPIILMIDELGKANPAVRNALTRILYERKAAGYTLHPDSIVFATTNLGSEGVGDMLLPHQWNRITTLTVRKPTHLEWLEWGISNGVDHTLLGWVRDNPQLFQSFDEVRDPEQNPYIFHPRDPSRKAFVTPRSLERASNIIKSTAGKVDDAVLTGALIGTLGARAAMDLMAFVTLAHELPTLDSIKHNPKQAKVPTSAAAVCMVVYRTLSTLDVDWIDNWMIYLNRLDLEAQGLFANGVRSPKYAKQSMVMLNGSFTAWVQSRAYLFSADKR